MLFAGLNAGAWMAALGAAGLAGWTRGRRTAIAGLVAVLAALGLAPGPVPLRETPVRAEGPLRVMSMPTGSSGDQTQFVGWFDHRKVRVAVPGSPRVTTGEVWEVSGTLRPLRETALAYEQAAGIGERLRVERFRRLEPAPWWSRAAEDARRFTLDFFTRHLTEANARWFGALTINAREGLTKEDRDALRATGTIHIVSASGSHVAAIVLALLVGLKAFTVPPKARVAVIAAVLAFFVLLTGRDPAVSRATWMAIVLLLPGFFRREGDLVSTWALAGLLALAGDPFLAQNPGFQLSFGTVGAFALFLPDPRLRTHRDRWRDALATSLVATLASAPLVAYWFGQVSVVGILANLLIEIALGLVVNLSLAAAVLGAIWEPAGSALLTLAVGPVAWIRWSVHQIGAWPGASFETPMIPSWGVAAFYVLAAAWGWRRRHA